MSFQFPRLIVDSAQKIAFIALLWITALLCTFVIFVIEIYNKGICLVLQRAKNCNVVLVLKNCIKTKPDKNRNILMPSVMQH